VGEGRALTERLKFLYRLNDCGVAHKSVQIEHAVGSHLVLAGEYETQIFRRARLIYWVAVKIQQVSHRAFSILGRFKLSIR
jgi:hypothetical protein